MADRPPFPHVQCTDTHCAVIHWGWIGRLFIVGIISTMTTVGFLTYAQTDAVDKHRVSDDNDAQIENNIIIMDRNMRKLDEQMRLQKAQNAHMVKLLNRLLQANGVTERIEAPPVEPSSMEPIK